MRKRKLLDRKGEEMVEAAIVLPILILVILSLVLTTLFFYRTLEAQVNLHMELTGRSITGNQLYKVEKGTTGTELEIRGAFNDVFASRRTGACYVINMAPLLRMGKRIDDDQE